MFLYAFAQNQQDPVFFTPGLASMVMPPLPTALKGCLAHGYNIAGIQKNFKCYVLFLAV